MITMPAFGWAFHFEVKGFALRVWTEIRRVGCTAIFVLGACAFSAANSRASSPGDTDATKPVATKTVAHKNHKSTANSASGTNPTTKTHTASTGKRSRRKRVRGQQKIDSERAQAIQESLIREHYLSGEATGTWNQASEAAMRRYQADNGWQSKTVPDSRALIKLGLGPSKDHLLNPESAMTTVPDPPRAEPMPTTSHTAPPTADTAPASSNQTDTSRPQ
jgi:hypothetical protein